MKIGDSHSGSRGVPERRAMPMRLANWNVEWATPRSRRSAEILGRIQMHSPEIVCLTESDIGLTAKDGHVTSSQEGRPLVKATVGEG